MKQLHDMWMNEVRKTPSGNTMLLANLVDRIATSARARGAPDVEAHARRLLQSFSAVVDGWRDAKRPRPQKSVEAFDKHFAAAEEVIDGERDPRKCAEDSRLAPVVRRGPLEPRPAVAVGGDVEL